MYHCKALFEQYETLKRGKMLVWQQTKKTAMRKEWQSMVPHPSFEIHEA
jgi:hypothetical protein